MITVWEGFLILTGALSGNLVMDDARGRSWEGLGLYAASIAVVLAGLLVLARGELGDDAAPESHAAPSGVGYNRIADAGEDY